MILIDAREAAVTVAQAGGLISEMQAAQALGIGLIEYREIHDALSNEGENLALDCQPSRTGFAKPDGVCNPVRTAT